MITLKSMAQELYLTHKTKIDFVASTTLAIGIPALLGAPLLPVVTGILMSGFYHAVVNAVLKKYILIPTEDQIEDPELKEAFTDFVKGEYSSEDVLNETLKQREGAVYKSLCEELRKKLLTRLANVEELKQVNELIPVLAKAYKDNDQVAFDNVNKLINNLIKTEKATYSDNDRAMLMRAMLSYAGYGDYITRIYYLTDLLKHKTEAGFGTKDASVGKLPSIFNKFFEGELKSEDLAGDADGNELVPLLRNVVKFEVEKNKITECIKLFTQFQQIFAMGYSMLSFAANAAIYKDLLSSVGTKTFDFSLGNFSFGRYLPEFIQSQKVPFFDCDGTMIGFGKLAVTAIATSAYSFAGKYLSRLITPQDSKESFVGDVQSSIIMTLLGNGIHKAFGK